MSDALSIQDYPQIEIVYPLKSTTNDEVKISQEDDRVSLISSATLHYKTERGAIYIAGTNSIIEVRCYVQFLHLVRRRVVGILFLEEFETGRIAGYCIIKEHGHGDDVIQFVIDESDNSTKVIAIQIRQCSMETARDNYQKIAAKFKKYGLENLTPLEPQEPVSPFVKLRCLLLCQDHDLTWHHYDVKSEAIMLKLPPSSPSQPRLVGVQPNVIRLSNGCALTVRLNRNLIAGYDSVTGAFLQLPGNPEQEVIISVSNPQDDRSDQDTVSLSIDQCVLPGESVFTEARIRLLGSSAGVDWCLEGGVTVLPASLPPTKLERQNRVMKSADTMDEVNWAAVVI